MAFVPISCLGMASSSEDSVFVRLREGLGLQDMLEEFDAIVIPVRVRNYCCLINQFSVFFFFHLIPSNYLRL